MLQAKGMEFVSQTQLFVEEALSLASRTALTLRFLRAEAAEDGVWFVIATSADGRLFVFEWVQSAGGDRKVFIQGEACGASYVRRPGAVDVEKDGVTPEERSVVHDVCRQLAQAPENLAIALVPSASEGTGQNDDATIDALTEAMREDLGNQLPALAEPWAREWHVEEIRSFRYWRYVTDIRLRASHGAHLGFLVFPNDPDEKVYARTRHLCVVYYSDDVAVEDHHATLYTRDGITIEGFVRWLAQWEVTRDGPWR